MTKTTSNAKTFKLSKAIEADGVYPAVKLFYSFTVVGGEISIDDGSVFGIMVSLEEGRSRYRNLVADGYAAF